VVGLSLALRSEAAGRGVGVLAVCPTAVETPTLDKGEIGGFVGRDFYRMGQRSEKFSSADELARDTLRAVERNNALLVWPRQARQAWLFARSRQTGVPRFQPGFSISRLSRSCRRQDSTNSIAAERSSRNERYCLSCSESTHCRTSCMLPHVQIRIHSIHPRFRRRKATDGPAGTSSLFVLSSHQRSTSGGKVRFEQCGSPLPPSTRSSSEGWCLQSFVEITC
jgi:hypothetical protein